MGCHKSGTLVLKEGGVDEVPQKWNACVLRIGRLF